MVRFHTVPLLTACRVDDGERFGLLAHWSLLVESTEAPNIVVYISEEEQFFVVSANAALTQKAHTRSAICWLRQGAGLGFGFDAAHGVFRIDVSRSRGAQDDGSSDQELAQLVSASVISSVFPKCPFCET